MNENEPTTPTEPTPQTPRLNITTSAEPTQNPDIYVVDGFHCYGKRQLRARLLEACKAKVEEMVAGLFPVK